MGAVLLAAFCGISFFYLFFLGLWYGMLVVLVLALESWWMLVGFVHISGYEVVECLFFSSFFFFFLGAGLWQNKTKGPK